MLFSCASAPTRRVGPLSTCPSLAVDSQGATSSCRGLYRDMRSGTVPTPCSSRLAAPRLAGGLPAIPQRRRGSALTAAAAASGGSGGGSGGKAAALQEDLAASSLSLTADVAAVGSALEAVEVRQQATAVSGIHASVLGARGGAAHMHAMACLTHTLSLALAQVDSHALVADMTASSAAALHHGYVTPGMPFPSVPLGAGGGWIWAGAVLVAARLGREGAQEARLDVTKLQVGGGGWVGKLGAVFGQAATACGCAGCLGCHPRSTQHPPHPSTSSSALPPTV